MAEKIRVSASILADITHQSRRALLVNKATLQKTGERMLTPIGGVIQVSDIGRAALIELLSVQNEDFERENELRVRNVPRRALKGFANWLALGVDREIDPLRELGEELVDETDLVRSAQLVGAVSSHMGYATEIGISQRTGDQTARVGDVCSVALPHSTLETLAEQADRPDSMLAFVTDAEIRAGVSDRGVTIAPISSFLIEQTMHPVWAA